MNRFKIKSLPLLAAALILLLGLGGCTARNSSSPVSGAAVSAVLPSSAPSSSLPSDEPTSQASSAARASSDTESSSHWVGEKRGSASSAAPKKQSGSSAAPSKPAAKYVTLTIDATKGGDGVVVSGKRVEIEAGETVYEVLKDYCGKNNILLSASKIGKGVYVSSIDGVAQFDNGPQSGWIYSVDGTFTQQDCNSYKLKGGETIKWVYTLDLGISEGSPR